MDSLSQDSCIYRFTYRSCEGARATLQLRMPYHKPVFQGTAHQWFHMNDRANDKMGVLSIMIGYCFQQLWRISGTGKAKAKTEKYEMKGYVGQSQLQKLTTAITSIVSHVQNPKTVQCCHRLYPQWEEEKEGGREWRR